MNFFMYLAVTSRERRLMETMLKCQNLNKQANFTLDVISEHSKISSPNIWPF